MSACSRAHPHLMDGFHHHRFAGCGGRREVLSACVSWTARKMVDGYWLKVPPSQALTPRLLIIFPRLPVLLHLLFAWIYHSVDHLLFVDGWACPFLFGVGWSAPSDLWTCLASENVTIVSRFMSSLTSLHCIAVWLGCCMIKSAAGIKGLPQWWSPKGSWHKWRCQSAFHHYPNVKWMCSWVFSICSQVSSIEFEIGCLSLLEAVQSLFPAMRYNYSVASADHHRHHNHHLIIVQSWFWPWQAFSPCMTCSADSFVITVCLKNTVQECTHVHAVWTNQGERQDVSLRVLTEPFCLFCQSPSAVAPPCLEAGWVTQFWADLSGP